jgi:diguanylate cyclase (GGDEF)-like protein
MLRLKLPRSYWLDRLILAFLIAATAWLSLTLARGPGELAAIWVGNGILTGWLLSRRTATWPGYLAVALAAELPARMLAGDEATYAVAIAACNITEALGVAWMVRSRVPDIRDPGHWVRLGGLATGATLLACAVSGVVAAAVAQAMHGQELLRAFGTWYAAHVVGMVIVATTTLVALRGKRRPREDIGGRWSIVATLTIVLAVGVVAFITPYPVLFLTYPPLLLAAVRHRFVGVAFGVITLALVGAVATHLGHGPLRLVDDFGDAGRIALLQLYLAGGCLMTIPVCLAMAERDRLAARLAANRLELERLSRVDALTGLANRRQFDERFALALKRLQRGAAPVVLMCLDIDRFKSINDGHGHAAGDAVLEAFGKRLCGSVRDTDLVARLGGDEFVVLLEDASAEAAETVARKVVASMADAIEVGGAAITATTSIGVAVAHAPTDAKTLMAEADALLYEAKKAGRNRYRVAAVD